MKVVGPVVVPMALTEEFSSSSFPRPYPPSLVSQGSRPAKVCAVATETSSSPRIHGFAF